MQLMLERMSTWLPAPCCLQMLLAERLHACNWCPRGCLHGCLHYACLPASLHACCQPWNVMRLVKQLHLHPSLHGPAPACRHAKNVNSDVWRRQQLLRSTSRPGHPFNSFSTGNADTLLHQPKVPGLAVRWQCARWPEARLVKAASWMLHRGHEAIPQACIGARGIKRGTGMY